MRGRDGADAEDARAWPKTPTTSGGTAGAAARAIRTRTRRDILVAAREEFVEFGLDGARVDRIAERAGANKRMLYHYFGNKEALYAAVLLDAYREIREGERELHLGDAGAGGGDARSWSASPSTTSAGNPWFIRLLATENIQRAAFVKQHPRDPRAAFADRRADPPTVLAAGRSRGPLPPRRRSDPALHLDRRRQLFLLLQHPHAVGRSSTCRSQSDSRDGGAPQPRGSRSILGYLRPDIACD